ncbi:hypothetical protein D3C74_467190 [compost metagenome]
MRFIHQQDCFLLPFLRQPLKADPGIIDIVIVANDRIAGIGGIERELERADLMLPGIRRNNLLCHQGLMLQHIQ